VPTETKMLTPIERAKIFLLSETIVCPFRVFWVKVKYSYCPTHIVLPQEASFLVARSPSKDKPPLKKLCTDKEKIEWQTHDEGEDSRIPGGKSGFRKKDVSTILAVLTG